MLSSLHFSHDGDLVTAAGDGGAAVWDIAAGRPLRTVPDAHSLVFGLDDAALFTASGHGLGEWDLRGDARSVRVVTDPDSNPINFERGLPAPDGDAVAYPSTDTLRVLDADRAELVALPLEAAEHRSVVAPITTRSRSSAPTTGRCAWSIDAPVTSSSSGRHRAVRWRRWASPPTATASSSATQRPGRRARRGLA